MPLDSSSKNQNLEEIPLSSVNPDFDPGRTNQNPTNNIDSDNLVRSNTNTSYTPNDETVQHFHPRRANTDLNSIQPNEPPSKDVRRNNTTSGQSFHPPANLFPVPQGLHGAYSPVSSTAPSDAYTNASNTSTSNLNAGNPYGRSSDLHRMRSLYEPDRSKTLNTVPEEEDSSDDEFVEIKHVMNGLDSKQLSEELKHPQGASDSSTSIDSHNEASPARRRGFRHYSRRQKKNGESKTAKVIKYLRGLVLALIRFSLITRCFFYWLPLALILFVPLAVGAWGVPEASLGHARIMWIFIWLEIVWASIWISRIVAHIIPLAFKFITSIISPGLKKYRSVLRALEVPISLVFWALISLCTFMPVMTQKANAKSSDATQLWQKTLNNILVALLISSLIYFGERLTIHLISVSFHKTRFATRIKDNKQSIRTLSDLLYCACIPFPPFCPEFSEEDLYLQSGSFLNSGNKSSKFVTKLAKNQNLQRFFGKVNHAFDVAANTLGKVARGQVLDNDDVRDWVSSTIADSMNSEALAEVLAKRIWMSLVLEGEEHLTIDDLVEVLGEERKTEANDIFRVLDTDGNGNLTLEEMVSSVVEICHERRSVYKSLKDVDSAIEKLHEVLLFIVMIIIIIVFIGMLAPSVSAVLATLGTTILALSFVFSTTAQEITASCVFLFVKHPLDVGDRVDIANDSYFVKEISLLYTVFTRVLDGSTVQAPNSVLNTLWIDNLSRAGPMTFTLNMILGLPETSFDQLDVFIEMVSKFCLDNPRDFQPDPFVYCTAYPDLDRVKLTCAVTFRSNFADGKLYSIRRSKVIQFVGRTIHDLGITLPRREDNSTDPGLPLHIQSIAPPGLLSIGSDTPLTSGAQNPFENPANITSGVAASASFGKRPGGTGSQSTLDDDNDSVSAELLDAIAQASARQQAKLFGRPRALNGFRPASGPAELHGSGDDKPVVEEVLSPEDAFAPSLLPQSQPLSSSAQVLRHATNVSTNYTIGSKASGISRSMTQTGRRRKA
jgi:small-conductance mechanosensitive channel